MPTIYKPLKARKTLLFAIVLIGGPSIFLALSPCKQLGGVHKDMDIWAQNSIAQSGEVKDWAKRVSAISFYTKWALLAVACMVVIILYFSIVALNALKKHWIKAAEKGNKAWVLSAEYGHSACVKYLCWAKNTWPLLLCLFAAIVVVVGGLYLNKHPRLLYGAPKRYLRCVAWLFEPKADIIPEEEDNNTALQSAQGVDKAGVVSYPSGAPRQQWFKAAENGDSKLLKKLFDSCRIDDINVRNHDNSTALILSAKKGHKACVQYLVEQSADITYKGAEGKTALQWAEEKGHQDVLVLLQKEWTKISNRNIHHKNKWKNIALVLGLPVAIVLYIKHLNYLLLLSSYKGCLRCVKWLHQQGADITFKGAEGKTALQWAAAKGQDDIVNYLSAKVQVQWWGAAEKGNKELLKRLYDDYPIKVNSSNEDGKTALLLSAGKGHLDCVKFLLQQGANIDAIGQCGNTALLLSACNGHLDVVMYLVAQGADLNAKNDDGNMPLVLSACNGHLDVVMYLVAQGAGINTRNNNGDTLLILSTRGGHLACVRYLVAQGAFIHATNKDGHTALILGAREGHLACVKSLVAQGADIHASDKCKYTALIWSVQEGEVDCVKYLLEQGATINTSDKWGNTALIRGAQRGHVDCIKYLCQQGGADINVKNKHGYTALLWSAQNGHVDCVKFLCQQGANIHTKNKWGDTALHKSAYYGHLEVVKYLVAQGADLHAKNQDGNTPLVLGARNGSLHGVTYLAQQDAGIHASNKWGGTTSTAHKEDVVDYLSNFW